MGSVASVQPLLVAELPFTFMLASVLFRVRPSRSEWLATASLTAGLALFLLCLGPEGGDPLTVPVWKWLVGLAVAGAVEAAAVLLGRACSGHRRALLLGIATGTGFGLTAALTAAAGAAYHQHGMLGVLLAWQTYAILVIGALSFYLLQNALGAGSLVASQPGLTLANPVVAVGWGILIFGERTRGGAWTVGVVAGALLIGLGTVLLARSPLLADRGERGRSDQSGAQASF
jgi:drug/metabolite transporter (DMT)-like permease